MKNTAARTRVPLWCSQAVIFILFGYILGAHTNIGYNAGPRTTPRTPFPRTNGSVETLYQEYMSDTRLNRLLHEYGPSFRSARPFPHVFIDDFLDADFVTAVSAEFAGAEFGNLCRSQQHTFWGGKREGVQCFHKSSDENESKKTAIHGESAMGPATRALFGLLKSSIFVEFLEKLTGIDDIIPDPHFRGSGLHQTDPGGFLRVHADFNRYERYGLDRRVNVFLFLNEHWLPAWGGALELWPRDVSRCETKIQPLFNRLVVFRTTDFSYHGYTDPIRSPYPRRSAALYYYTNGRPVEEKIDPTSDAHSTLWQKVKCAMQSDDALAPKCVETEVV